MKHLQKPSLVEERAFPFECSNSYGVEEEFRVLHWHQEMEICYIKQGTGSYLINGVEYSFSPGDIFIINNDEIHLCHHEQNLVMQVIMFDPTFLYCGSANPMDTEYLRPFLEASGNFCNKLDGTSPQAPLLTAVLAEIEQEYNGMQKGYELMIKSLLLQFLTLIIRHFSVQEFPDAQEPVSPRAAEIVRQVMLYAEGHYQEPLTLELLAAEFHISVPYLCSSFKALTGLSPIDFVIRKRITEAKRALAETDKSVLTVSEECGFRSLSNFNHLFKTLVGSTPSAYRRSRAGGK